MISTINLPANFAAALKSGRLASMADARVHDGFDQFARGLARASCGRSSDARADFEAARADVGPAADVELALLDLQVPGKARLVENMLEQLATTVPTGSMLAARSRHILGLARNKVGNLHGARAALLEALEAYQTLDCTAGQAQTRDSLGSVLADCGRLDDAAHHYTLSIAMKAQMSDPEGLSISLGNLGRLQLRAGRIQAAVECFEADLKLIEGHASDRTRARLLNDLARAQLAAGDPGAAIERLDKSLQIARARGYADMVCLILKDLTLAYVATGDFAQAEQMSRQAAEQLPANAELYLRAYWQFADGTLLTAQGHADAVGRLTEACELFRGIPFAEGEIESLIGLARANLVFGSVDAAETCVLQALDRAESSSLRRFVPELNKLLFDVGAQRSPGLTSPIEAELGSTASRFVVLGRLGGGAFGEVYRVYDNSLLSHAALKVIRMREVYDEAIRSKLRTSIERELQVGMTIQHPGVAKVFQVGQFANDSWFVLQEIIEGVPLDSLMRGGKGDLKQGCVLIANIAMALDALHNRGVVHCDVKPANIILRSNGLPVLIDFGVAQVRSNSAPAAGSVMGSVPYMSPEQAAGRAVDGLSDVYSLGVLAFEWFAGERPLVLRGGSPEEIAKLLQTANPLPLRRVRPDAPQALEQIISRCLSRTPNSRPQSAREVAEFLLAISGRLSP